MHVYVYMRAQVVHASVNFHVVCVCVCVCVCVHVFTYMLISTYIATLQATFQKKRSPNECSEDTWSMTQLSHQNKTTNPPHLYVYKTNKVGATNDCHYHCSECEFIYFLIFT